MGSLIRSVVMGIVALCVSVGAAPAVVGAEHELPGEPRRPDGWVEPSCVNGLAKSPYFTDLHADVLRLYWAFFNRDPDLEGAKYWIGVSDDGYSLDGIADSFSNSPEFDRAYGSASNQEFLERIYLNVLGRDYDQAGFDYWLDLLDGGELTRGGVVRWVAANAEFVGKHPYPAWSGYRELDVPASSTFSGFNNSGELAGYSRDDVDDTYGFILHADGILSIFFVARSEEMSVAALNDLGDVAGSYVQDGISHGYLRLADGTLTTVEIPEAESTTADAINNNGAVAGSYRVGSESIGFIRQSDGTYETFSAPGGAEISVIALNDADQVMGTFGDQYQSFLRSSDGTFTTIELPDALFTFATALNNDGEVAGTDQGFGRGFVRSIDGTLNTFEIPGLLGITDLNESGWVSGSFLSQEYPTPAIKGRGLIRSPDGVVSMFDGPVVNDTRIRFINDSGKAMGTYVEGNEDFTTTQHAFIVDSDIC